MFGHGKQLEKMFEAWFRKFKVHFRAGLEDENI
jgi:hypothetical protein